MVDPDSEEICLRRGGLIGFAARHGRFSAVGSGPVAFYGTDAPADEQRHHRRINALLLDDGWTAERVAEALFINAETAAKTEASGRDGGSLAAAMRAEALELKRHVLGLGAYKRLARSM